MIDSLCDLFESKYSRWELDESKSEMIIKKNIFDEVYVDLRIDKKDYDSSEVPMRIGVYSQIFSNIMSVMHPLKKSEFDGFPKRKLINDSEGYLGFSRIRILLKNNTYLIQAADLEYPKLDEIENEIEKIRSYDDLRHSIVDGGLKNYLYNVEQVWTDLFICFKSGKTVKDTYEILREMNYRGVQGVDEKKISTHISSYFDRVNQILG